MYRKTYVEIDEEILKQNIKEITEKYKYSYYFGVVKNNAYNHGMHVVNSLIEGGVNYLCTSSLEEALSIRKYNESIPILVLEPIALEFIDDVINNNITITVESLDYLKELNEKDLSYKVKIHLKIDSGMNRLGFKNKNEINKANLIIKDNKYLELEGIYTHLATSGYYDVYYDKQINTFKNLIKNINLSKLIVHVDRSLTFVSHEKLSFVNGVRLGIAMYGFNGSKVVDTSLKGKFRNLKRKRFLEKNDISSSIISNDLNLNTAFKLYTSILSIRKVSPLEIVGYGALYKVKEEGYIITLPIGYADGVDKTFKYVVINNKKYEIVADSMDMLMVFSKDMIAKDSKVEVFGDTIPVKEVTRRLNINAYHLFNRITTRVPRIHIKGTYKQETKY